MRLDESAKPDGRIPFTLREVSSVSDLARSCCYAKIHIILLDLLKYFYINCCNFTIIKKQKQCRMPSICIFIESLDQKADRTEAVIA